MDSVDTPIQSGIIVLASGRDANELGFSILGDHADLLAIQLASRVAGQSCSHGNHQRGGTGYPCARGRFRVGLNLQAAFRNKKAQKISGESVLVSARGTKFVEAGEFLLATGVNGFEMDALSWQGGQSATSKDVDAEVNGDRSRMKEVERPDIHGAAGQINPAGRVRNDRSVVGQVYSVKNCAIWRNLL